MCLFRLPCLKGSQYLRTYIRALHLPKDGNSWEEYEDAWAWGGGATTMVSSRTSAQKEARIFKERMAQVAVADGASDAFEGRLWALALVEAFIQLPLEMRHERREQAEEIKQWLELPIQTWKNGIPWDKLPWYAEEKARRGAFSTLLGVSFSYLSDINSRWHAIAVGDSCLFQIRDEQVFVRFPINRAKDFGIYPPLISTQQEYNCCSLKNLCILKGECRPGDLFVLATDALAAWFLKQLEIDREPWQRLNELDWEKFVSLIENLRQKNEIRNDDVTLLLVWVEKEPKLTPTSVHKDIKVKYRW